MRTSVKTLAAGSLAAATFLIAPAAMAAPETGGSTASVQVNAGALTVAPGATTTLGDVTTDKDGETATGTMTLKVDDARGTDEGWNIVQTASPLSNGDETIGADKLRVTGVSAPAKNAGLDTNDNRAVAFPTGSSFALDNGGGTVLSAPETAGEGEYTANVALALDVPAYSKAGTYTGTLTSTNSITPGADA